MLVAVAVVAVVAPFFAATNRCASGSCQPLLLHLHITTQLDTITATCIADVLSQNESCGANRPSHTMGARTMEGTVISVDVISSSKMMGAETISSPSSIAGATMASTSPHPAAIKQTAQVELDESMKIGIVL